MLPALALMTFSMMIPSEANLGVSNVRITYGALGPTRPEAKLVPGDSLFVGFDIEGITIDDAGKFDWRGRPIRKERIRSHSGERGKRCGSTLRSSALHWTRTRSSPIFPSS